VHFIDDLNATKNHDSSVAAAQPWLWAASNPCDQHNALRPCRFLLEVFYILAILSNKKQALSRWAYLHQHDDS
jgi:hypothetical protein